MNQPFVQSTPTLNAPAGKLRTLSLAKGEVKLITSGSISEEDYEFMETWIKRLRAEIVKSPLTDSEEKDQDE